MGVPEKAARIPLPGEEVAEPRPCALLPQAFVPIPPKGPWQPQSVGSGHHTTYVVGATRRLPEAQRLSAGGPGCLQARNPSCLLRLILLVNLAKAPGASTKYFLNK